MPDHPPPGRATTVAPLEVDGVRTAVVGTGLWLGGLVVLVVMRDRLGDEGHGWWVATAAVGFVLGLVGIAFLLRRRSAYRRGSTPSEGASGSPQDS